MIASLTLTLPEADGHMNASASLSLVSLPAGRLNAEDGSQFGFGLVGGAPNADRAIPSWSVASNPPPDMARLSKAFGEMRVAEPIGLAKLATVRSSASGWSPASRRHTGQP